MEEEDAVAVVEFVGLLTIKENSGFGAFEESAEGYKYLIMMCTAA